MSLSEDLRYWINLSHALAWQGTAETASDPAVKEYLKPDEPGLVAALLDSSIQQGLEGILANFYNGTATVRIDSIFTHKTPTVEFEKKTPVEIGDLLLVRQHFDPSNFKSQGKALLLQAKKNAEPNSGSVSSGNPNTQFELYRRWPEFNGATRLNRGPWNFDKANANRRFGKYLAVFEGHAHVFTPPDKLGAETTAFSQSNYPTTPPPLHKTAWADGPVDPNASAKNCVECPSDFADTLAGFFLGNVGEQFIPGPVGNSFDWSDFVNNMIDVASESDYTFVSRRTNVQAPTSRSATISSFVAIQRVFKLAILDQVKRYVPRYDGDGLPNFESEPHFFYMAMHKSSLVKELNAMDKDIRNILRKNRDEGEVWNREPPLRPIGSERAVGGEGHVPILLVSTLGREQPWKD